MATDKESSGARTQSKKAYRQVVVEEAGASRRFWRNKRSLDDVWHPGWSLHEVITRDVAPAGSAFEQVRADGGPARSNKQSRRVGDAATAAKLRKARDSLVCHLVPAISQGFLFRKERETFQALQHMVQSDFPKVKAPPAFVEQMTIFCRRHVVIPGVCRWVESANTVNTSLPGPGRRAKKRERRRLVTGHGGPGLGRQGPYQSVREIDPVAREFQDMVRERARRVARHILSLLGFRKTLLNALEREERKERLVRVEKILTGIAQAPDVDSDNEPFMAELQQRARKPRLPSRRKKQRESLAATGREKVRRWLADHPEFSQKPFRLPQLAKALGTNLNKSDEQAIGRALQSLGYRKGIVGPKRVRVWVPPG